MLIFATADILLEEALKMIGNSKEDGKWSEKKVQVKDDLRTLECLRGRLLAERQASRVANENAELMANKLKELENQLKEETNLRNKAEKKLKFLKKKLNSLKISFPLDESEQSSSSENCAESCKSSTSTPGLKDKQESESKQQKTTPEFSEYLVCNVSESITSNQSHEISSLQENSSSSDTAISSIKDPPHEISSNKSSPSCEDSNADHQNSTSKKTSVEAVNESDTTEDNVDNSMALVPMTFRVKSQTTQTSSERKIMSGSVREALDALRLAREKIQSSMERRHMIRVGPS